MTAEIVIMNREGVAMAADSMVTVGANKVFDTATKLHMLAPGYSIGVMVFNSALFMDLPWEVVIKEYRAQLAVSGRRFQTVQECANDFLDFLVANESSLSVFGQQRNHVSVHLASFLNQLADTLLLRFRSEILRGGPTLTKSQLEKIIEETIRIFSGELEGFPDAFEAASLKEFAECFEEKFASERDSLIKEYLDQTPLSNIDRERLSEACLNLFVKRLPTNSYSGLVFAGFGDQELLPSCVSYKIESLICGKLNFSAYKSRSIDFDGASAAIVPFAQDDAVVGFMEGRHPVYFKILRDEAEAKLSEAEQNDFFERVRDRHYQEHTIEILRTVTSLPKEDLALVAETMVNLTSFMRKVQMQMETVGGPIDIALISRKDGFIWIKRKHYFKVEYNPYFLAR